MQQEQNDWDKINQEESRLPLYIVLRTFPHDELMEIQEMAGAVGEWEKKRGGGRETSWG